MARAVVAFEWVGFAALAGILVFACDFGGSDDELGPGEMPSTPGDTDPARCPAAAPVVGASCSFEVEPAYCTYGDQADCGQVFACWGGSWNEVGLAGASANLCPPAGQGVCDEVPTPGAPCDSAGLQCGFADGEVCACEIFSPADDAQLEWQCMGPQPSPCPPNESGVLEIDGQVCDAPPDTRCDWFWCTATCEEGEWLVGCA